jgi:transposase InsO family protein
VHAEDNGSEFTSRAFDVWAYARGVKLEFIQPGKPILNAFIESFNGDCLNLQGFVGNAVETGAGTSTGSRRAAWNAMCDVATGAGQVREATRS